MRARLVFATNLALGAALLAFVLVRYGAPALDLLSADFSAPALAAFSIAVAGTIATLSWRGGWVLGSVVPPPALIRLALFRSAAHTLAVVIPSGKLAGDPLRAWLLVRDEIPPGPAISAVAVDRALELASTSPFSVVFAAILFQHGIPDLEGAFVTLGAGMVGLVVGCWIAAVRLRTGSGLVAPLVRAMKLDRVGMLNRQMGVLAETDAAGAKMVGHTSRMAVAFGTGLLANGLVLVEFALLLAAFGLPTTVETVVAVTFATGAAHMLPVPAGIGVLEGANVWLFQMLGHPPDVGLAVGLAARLRELIWMLPGIAYLLTGSLRSTLSEVGEP